jgi:hypothetical protein
MTGIRGYRQLHLAAVACAISGILLIVAAVTTTRPVLAASTGVTAVVHEGDTETAPAGGLIDGCTLHLHFSSDADVQGDWAIREGDDFGPNVLTGSYDTSSGDDREPNTGTLTLASGAYFLVWDDESPIDRSFDQLAFDVACEAPTNSGGSELPTNSGGSELPIDSGGSGSEAPINGGGSPSGAVLGVVGTPAPTLPATDTGLDRQPSTDLRPTLGLLALIGAGALALTNRRTRRRVPGDDEADGHR